jgi:hypothetical protein
MGEQVWRRHFRRRVWAEGTSRLPPGFQVSVADFDEGKIAFDRIFEELRDHGWRGYTPYETWD